LEVWIRTFLASAVDVRASFALPPGKCFDNVKAKNVQPMTDFESDFLFPRSSVSLADVIVKFYDVSSTKLEMFFRSVFSVQVANHTAYTYALLSNYNVSNSK
jgi:hypothetical protein